MFEGIIGILLLLVITAVVHLIVKRFKIGVEVDGFGSAFLAAIVIAIVGGGIVWLLNALNINLLFSCHPVKTALLLALVLLKSQDFIAPDYFLPFEGSYKKWLT